MPNIKENIKENPDIDLSQYPYINKGLAGVVAFTTCKSSIDGEKGELIYGGYNINTLAKHGTFEEVCFLLWEDRLPNKKELDQLKKKLRSQRTLPDHVKEFIKTVPKDAEPMSVLRSAVSMLADSEDANQAYTHISAYEEAVRIVARMPTIIAAFDRVRRGKEIVEPLEEHSTAENFLYMLNGEKPGEKSAHTMDLCLILHAEHGMNASTFTSRTICSTESDIYSAVTGAIGCLKGPLHGGANMKVMNMLLELKEQGENADPEGYVKDKLANKQKISGFGHRVYKTFDPRALLLRDMAEDVSKETGEEFLYELSQRILKTMTSEKDIDPNVDYFSAPVYYSLGIDRDLFTCIFSMSRAAGWTGHYIEQLNNNKLIRPRAIYVGERNREWEPLNKR